MTNPDKSVYVFDNDGNLLSKIWSNGERWTYSYSGDDLVEVNDGYNRKLVFRYYSSGSHAGQLYRIGDQTFDDSNSSSPTGRYVEYGYTRNKLVDNTGAIVNGSNSLLTSVRDISGHLWTYEYYLEDGDDADVRKLNYLTVRFSPSVDTDGDGTLNESLLIEEVSYALQGTELAANGDMELNSNWSSVSSPTTNIRSSAQAADGTYSRYVETSAAGQGIESSSWNLVSGKTYIITAKVYPVSGTIKMQVGSILDRTSSGTGAWELLRAVHTATADDTGKTLQFVSSGGAAQFYIDSVSILESDLTISTIHQERGEAAIITDYAFQPGGQNITTETTVGKVTTHHFSEGVYAGTELPGQNGQYGYQGLNEKYRPDYQTDANGNTTAMGWNDDGTRLNGVMDSFGATTLFQYYPDGSTVEGALKASVDAQGRKTTYIYEGALRQPALIVVSKPTDPSLDDEIAIHGDMEILADWTDVGSPTTNAASVPADSGDYSRYVQANSIGQGIESAAWDIIDGREYTITARVYPISGSVSMQVPGDKLSNGYLSRNRGVGDPNHDLYCY